MKLKNKKMLNYILSQNLFTKKNILLEVAKKSCNLSKEELAEQVFKINNMNEDEINSTLRMLVEMYG